MQVLRRLIARESTDRTFTERASSVRVCYSLDLVAWQQRSRRSSVPRARTLAELRIRRPRRAATGAHDRRLETKRPGFMPWLFGAISNRKSRCEECRGLVEAFLGLGGLALALAVGMRWAGSWITTRYFALLQLEGTIRSRHFQSRSCRRTCGLKRIA